MNTSMFINYFPEIADLERETQAALLEQARYVSFTELMLSSKSAAYFILSILVSFAFPALSVLLFGFSILINSLFIGVGCLMSLLLYKKLYATLLQKGLKKVLKRDVSNCNIQHD